MTTLPRPRRITPESRQWESCLLTASRDTPIICASSDWETLTVNVDLSLRWAARTSRSLASRVATLRNAEILEELGGAAQALAEQRDHADGDLRPLLDEGQKIAAGEEEKLRTFAGDRRSGAAFAVEERDLAEKIARAEHVEDELLAAFRLHLDDDAAAEHAVEAVARLVLAEHGLSRPVVSDVRVRQQCTNLVGPEHGQQMMPLDHLLGGHGPTPL